MRTQEQVSRVCATLNLSRRQRSILEWKRMQIFTQRQLTEVALDLQKLSEDQCVELLNYRHPIDTIHSLHF